MDFIFDPSLVFYLPLYEPDGASLMSRDARGHLCSVTGAVWTPAGRSFDGLDDLINCGNNAILDCMGVVTVEVWVKLNAIAQYKRIVGKETVSTNGYVLLLASNAENNRFYFGVQNAATGRNSAVFVPGAASPVVGQWYHVVGTYDGYVCSSYVDGVLNGSVAYGTYLTIGVTVANLLLASVGSSFTNCSMAEVRIYSRSLSPLEIRRNYLATKWRYL